MFKAIKDYFSKISNKKKVSPITNANLPIKPVEAKVNNFIQNKGVPDAKLSATKTNFSDMKLEIQVAEVVVSPNNPKTTLQKYNAPESCTPVNMLPDRTNSLSPVPLPLPHALNTADTLSPKSNSDSKKGLSRGNTLSPTYSSPKNDNATSGTKNTSPSNNIYNSSTSPSNSNDSKKDIEGFIDLAKLGALFNKNKKPTDISQILDKIRRGSTLTSLINLQTPSNLNLQNSPNSKNIDQQNSPASNIADQKNSSNDTSFNISRASMKVNVSQNYSQEPHKSPLGNVVVNLLRFNETDSSIEKLNGTLTSTLEHKVEDPESDGSETQNVEIKIENDLKTHESASNQVSNHNNLNAKAVEKRGHGRASKRFSFDSNEIAKLLSQEDSQATEINVTSQEEPKESNIAYIPVDNGAIEVTSQATEINVTANTQVEPEKENLVYIPVDNDLSEVTSPKNETNVAASPKNVNVTEAISPQTKKVSPYPSEENDSESYSDSNTSKIKRRLLFGLSSSPYTQNNRINTPAKTIPVTPKYEEAIKQYETVGLMFNNQNKAAAQKHAVLMHMLQVKKQRNI